MIKEDLEFIIFFVSSSLEFKNDIYRALKNIVKFATTHGWEELVTEPFLERVNIYDSQEALFHEVKNHFNLDSCAHFPSTFCAIIDHKILYTVSPKLYQKIYPIEGKDTIVFERLLTHEIAHHLHIRILAGYEELMGPRWFYEGFAIVVANQFPQFGCNEETIWDIISNDEDITYYGAIVCYLTEYIDLKELIHHASHIDFSNWLRMKIR